jgi:hypothetical protein
MRNYLTFALYLTFCHLTILSTSSAESPVLAPLSVPRQLSEGQKLRLICNVLSGTLPVQFEWTKEDRSLASGSRTTIRRLTEEVSELETTNLKFEDIGNYSCLARNSFGSDVSTVNLQIKGIDFIWVEVYATIIDLISLN